MKVWVMNLSPLLSTFSSPMEDSEHNEVYCMCARMHACLSLCLFVVCVVGLCPVSLV